LDQGYKEEVELDSLVTQLGVGGIFAVLLIKMILEFLEKWDTRKQEKKRAETGDLPPRVDHHDIMLELMSQGKKLHVVLQKVEITEKRTEDLWHWCGKEDADGVKLMYLRGSLTEAISKLADATSKQTEVLTALARDMEEVAREQRQANEMLRALTARRKEAG
jgi:hypothetical protein